MTKKISGPSKRALGERQAGDNAAAEIGHTVQALFCRTANLSSETVEGSALPLERVDDVHRGHSLPLGVLRVGDGVPDDVLEEHLQHSTGLFVDESGDALDAATTGQSTDGRLRDSLDVVAENLAVTLGAPFAESLAALAASRHDDAVAGVLVAAEMNDTR